MRILEATPRIELGMEVLQTSALPLGYVAAVSNSILRSPRTPSLRLEFAGTPQRRGVGPPYSWRNVAEQRFRDVMARLPAGVVVVSARFGDEFRGLTASSLVSISLEPPMIIVGLEHASATRAAIL